MRILILANLGMGLYKFRKELLEELIKLNNEVYVSIPNDEYVPLLEKIGCKYIETNLSRRGTNPVADLKLLLKYSQIIKKIEPDIVLTYTIKPNIYGGIVCRMLGVPYIVNITGLGSAVEHNGYLQKLTLLLYKLALKRAKCVFFQNIENSNFLNSKIKIGHQRLIPGSGVNLEQFALLDYPPDGVINFLFISRIMKEKGIEQYLEAAKFIKKKYPNTRFHVVGFCEETYEAQLTELQKQGIIEYHGVQNDVRKFHKISHCTIHPSYYPEGMSNVLLESAACGRPVITTDRSGCKEIVDDGINGFLIKQKNTEDLIHKIEKFLKLSNEERKIMGLRGRSKVEKEFDRQIVLRAYMEEINRITI
jgi:galacturonosyltransferase